MDVPAVHLDTLGVINVASAAHLPHAGDARAYHVVFSDIFAVFWHFFLNDGPGADETHLAFQHVQELGELVEAGLPKEGAGLRDARIVFQLEGGLPLFPCFGISVEQFLETLGRVYAHAAEFVAVKLFSVSAHAAMLINDRAGGVAVDPERHPEEDG